MNPENTELWRSQIEATLKAAMAAPGANEVIPFTAGLLAGLLGVSAKSAGLGLEFAQEVLLKQRAAPAAFDPLALVEPIAQAIEKAVDLRVAALREQLLEDLRR